MRTVEADYGYQVQRLRDHYEISYRGGKWGFGYIALGMLALVPFFIWFMLQVVGAILNLINGAAMLIGLLIGIVGAILIPYLRNKKRPTKIIRVYRDSVVFEGQQYASEHITDLYVKGPNNLVHKPTATVPDNSTLSGMGAAGVFGVVGVAASGLSAATTAFSKLGDGIDSARTDLINREKSKSGWSIWFDYGAKPTRMATGLDQRRANLMFQELSRLIVRRTV